MLADNKKKLIYILQIYSSFFVTQSLSVPLLTLLFKAILRSLIAAVAFKSNTDSCEKYLLSVFKDTKH